jgi:hypothetical protein
VLIFVGHFEGISTSRTARDDRNFADRIGMFKQVTDDSVTRFVVGRNFFITLTNDPTLTFWAKQYFFNAW